MLEMVVVVLHFQWMSLHKHHGALAEGTNPIPMFML